MGDLQIERKYCNFGDELYKISKKWWSFRTKRKNCNLHFKKNHEIVKTSLKKNNISYLVIKNINKRKKLIELVEKIKSSIIIYANTRKNVENISKYLNYNKYNSCFYHAGLSYENRKNIQEKWIYIMQKNYLVWHIFNL